MEFLADGLLIATAMTAGLYCLVLSRRLQRLTDSGEGIGPQIEALDQALDETQAALKDARDGISELRSSSKAAFAQLTRETAQGEEMAERIERGIEEAKATMQRLYQAGDRIEAHENRSAKVSSVASELSESGGDTDAAEGLPVIDAQPVVGENPHLNWSDEDGETDNGTDPDDYTGRPQVALPEGEIVEAGVAPAAGSRTTRQQSGSVLKAERVVL